MLAENLPYTSIELLVSCMCNKRLKCLYQSVTKVYWSVGYLFTIHKCGVVMFYWV